MASIHDNQRSCGDRIIQAFRESYNHVVLLAQMQMGKSGAYWHVICTMLADSSCGIENVVLISGNRERELRQQVNKDRKEYCNYAIEQIVNSNEGLSESDKRKHTRELRKRMEDHIKILWGHDLTPSKEAPYVIQDNTLIVWDESHYAQSDGNSPSIWFKHNAIHSFLNGEDVDTVKARNIRLLNVSATPFSELLIQSIQTQSHKTVIRLEPAPTYCGVRSYFERNRVFPSFDIKTCTQDELRALLMKYNDVENPQYVLARVPTTRCVDIFRKACVAIGMRLYVLNSKKQDITVDDLQDEPTQPTVVVITGMLRMGKVVPKEHLSMVFESSITPENSNTNTKKTDTGLQGLMGRVCGHASTNEGFDIDIYIDDEMIDQMKRYIEGYDEVSGPLNDNAMNVRKAESRPRDMDIDHITVHTMPVKLVLSDAERSSMLNKSGTVRKAPMKAWLMEHRDAIDWTVLSDEEKERVFAVLSDLDNTNGIVFKNLNSEALLKFTDSIYSSVQNGKPMFRKKTSSLAVDTLTICKWGGQEESYPGHLKSIGGSIDDIWMTVTLTYPKSEEEIAKRNYPLYMISKKCVFLPSPT